MISMGIETRSPISIDIINNLRYRLFNKGGSLPIKILQGASAGVKRKDYYEPVNNWMKKIILIIIITFFNFGCHVAPAGRTSFERHGESGPKTAEPKVSTGNNTVTDSTDIHYNSRYCTECHTKIPNNKTGDSKFLKYNGDYKQLCKCHYETQPRDSHPVDMPPSEDMKARIPREFPLIDQKLSCSTCHDVYMQCQDVRDPYLRQKNFLRGGQTRNILDFCFRCHDIKKFNRYNPHKQLNDKGETIQETCLYCHSEVPSVKEINRQNSYLIGDRTALCIGCHNPVDKTSLHYRHLRRPSAGVLERINRMGTEYNIALPLTDSGMVTCVTCHDPHQDGLIPGYRLGAIDPKQEKNNQFSGNLCNKCHEIK